AALGLADDISEIVFKWDGHASPKRQVGFVSSSLVIPGSARALACPFRRLAGTKLGGGVKI
ncbi:MAG: hypothetical protein M3Q86_04395, partial [Verrucomicrobiota bacterium]|nr:hypothetical protein [Verrucomicrobiota bacterium]